jgi:hypothetical protein
MNNQEIKQKLDDDSLILANQLMAFVQNPPALKYMDEIRNSIQKTISKTKTESFNLGVTLSAENAEIIVNSFKQEGKSKEQYEDITSDEYQTEHKNLDGKSKLCISVKPSKDSILKLLIK